MRRQPFFTLTYFVFHVSLFVVPIFLLAHNMLLQEAFGIGLWSMPEGWSDALTIVLLVSVVVLAARRILRPEVRILTSAGDYVLLILTALPFVTGLLAYHQWTDYRATMILHVLTSEVLLVVIPFTKLSHILLFFVTRAFIGFEMGARRGARSW
jgi:nitrate reductase gamma subunit